VTHWSMAEVEAELGLPEPEYYATGAPLTASWVKWWHDALNLLTHARFTLNTFQMSFREGEGVTFSDAEGDWLANDWSALGGFPTANLFADHRQGFPKPYLIRRQRLTANPADPFSPGSYANNYTLSAWSQFTMPNIFTYENNDYPCDRSTYAKIFADTSVQSGEYDKQITVGDFSTVTGSSPADNSRIGWVMDDAAFFLLCQCNIEGGFEYVAPEE